MSWPYAICNETFDGWDHGRVCDFVAKLGYQGLEIAPFTLAPRITEVSQSSRKELRHRAESVGLQIIGLHWLLAKTEGLCITSPDEGIRRATTDYLSELTRACHDLGGRILVFGSPKQRCIPLGHDRQQATDFALKCLAPVTKVLEQFDVLLCLEPLAPTETDFLNTARETVEFANRLSHPNVRLHLDVKAMASELLPAHALIREFADSLAHFHANDPNGRGPGFGETDFRPIFNALADINYPGWVSVEVFDYLPDPETIARDSLRYMKRCETS